MRKLLSVVLVTLLVAACDQVPTRTDTLVTAPELSAATKIVDDKGVIDLAPFLFFVECTGEDVLFAGTFRFHVKIWDNGHANGHFDVDIQGVGQDTGLKYNGKQVQNISIGPGGLPFAGTVHLSVVSATSADNLVVTVHLTINENGEVTASLGSAECRG